MLSVDALLNDAQRASGLSDYGPMDFAQGLRVLVDAINREAGLSPQNEEGAREYLVRLLANRLRMQRDLKNHPEILDEEILPPVFITSLPRTGSTKLHRLLAATGDFNGMKFWQGHNFAPYAENDLADPANDPRIAEAKDYLAWTTTRSTEYLEGHPMYPEEVEEERLLLNAGFNSLYDHACYFTIPSYVDWVIKQDPKQVFEEMRRTLQYLQWQHYRGQRRRWLLKTPSQFGTEAVLAQVFPGMDFIVAYRPPEQIFASVCALLIATLRLYNDRDLTGVAGEMMLYSFGETVKSHLKWRDQYPANKVFDVTFKDVVGNELELLPRIYGFLGMTFSERSRINAEAWLNMDAARRITPSKYTLADFGLTAGQVNKRFAAYIQRYQSFFERK